MNNYFKVNCKRGKSVVINCAFAGGKLSLGSYNSEELWNNLKIVDNLINLNEYYDVLINIGSGAEYDISKPIIDVYEGQFSEYLPKDSYGLAKNLIAKRIIDGNHGFNLRLFGCFDQTEPEYRFIKTMLNSIRKGKPIVINRDKYFSWVSGEDLAATVNWICNQVWLGKAFDSLDINCAYSQKILLSELAYHVCRIYEAPINVIVEYGNSGLTEYSCDSSLLASQFKMPMGLFNSLEHYIRSYKKNL